MSISAPAILKAITRYKNFRATEDCVNEKRAFLVKSGERGGKNAIILATLSETKMARNPDIYQCSSYLSYVFG